MNAKYTLLGFLRSISTSSSLPVHHASKVYSSANKLVFDTRQILRPPASNQYNAVFLQIVTFALDIRLHRLPVRQFHTSNFAFGGIGLFGVLYVYLADDPLFRWVVFEER